MQWAEYNAYWFFPRLEDETFGLSLHPFDLATNNVMAGRLEAREWIDVINWHQQLQSRDIFFERPAARIQDSVRHRF